MPLALAPFIPQELFDHIIDHLHNEYSTLLNCSLVCQAWVPSSRLHLFSQIFLTIPKFQEGTFIGPVLTGACTRLFDLLTKSPEIVPHIHELSITCSDPVDDPTPATVVEAEAPVYGLVVEEKLPPLLSMLSSLRRFAFVSGGNMSWANIPECLRRAINDVFSLSTLTYVRLCSWIFPDPSSFTALLGQSPNLKGLALWGITFGPDSLVPLFSVLSLTDADSIKPDENNDEEMPLTTAKLGPNLEFLTLDYIDFTPLGDWLLTQPSLLGLIGLRELRVAHSNIKSIERLLRGLGDSLQHFHLKPGPLGCEYHSFLLSASWRILIPDYSTAHRARSKRWTPIHTIYPRTQHPSPILGNHSPLNPLGSQTPRKLCH